MGSSRFFTLPKRNQQLELLFQSAYPAMPEVIGAGHDVFDPERT
jgi:hypothetical protein